MIGFLEIAIGFIAVFFGLYFYSEWKQSFWKSINVEGPKPIPIFGNFFDIIFGNASMNELLKNFFLTWKDKPFVGLYEGMNPSLLIIDPDIIKHVLIKDFGVFTNRGVLADEKTDPLAANLFLLEGHRWKGLRSKISPVFTSGKLKQMYHLLTECAEQFEYYISEQLTKNDNVIEVKEAAAKFTTDVIGSCAFGLNLNSFNDEESKFRKMGLRIVTPRGFDVIKNIVRFLMPGLIKFFKVRIFPEKETDFFMNSIAETVAYRKKNGIVRPDFIHLMMQLQENPDNTDFEMTDGFLAAQAFIFFLAGFETSSATMSFALFELAQNKEIQDKLRAEIRDSLKEHDGSTPYEAVNELEYLDKIFKETLRKYPVVPSLPRTAAKDYTLPGSTVRIPAGTKIVITALGLHHDPKYYPKPEVFDPERFSEEAIQQRPQMVYLPFGEGPRNCIGARFANYQTKIGILKIIKNYEVTLSPKMRVPIVYDKPSPFLAVEGGVYLEFKKIS